MKKQLCTAIAFFCFLSQASATVTLLDKDDWVVKFGGFVEFDSIVDSSRSLLESPGNTPIDRPGTANGSNGRTQFSIRNTRFDLDVQAPTVNGTRSRGYLEFDFLGTDPAPPAGTEASFFNSPTLRMRHGFIEVKTDNDWTFLAGQTWQILGWQPYYFLNTVDVSPLPGQLYNRTVQLHAMKKVQVNEMIVQAMVGAMRPPQRDSGYPALEGGLRLSYEGRKSGFNGGSSGVQVTQPMSIAVSGTFREIEVPTLGSVSSNTNYPGAAIALDALVPVLASSDGKSVSNTLSLVGEFTTGTGYGDEFNSWTGNVANPLSGASDANSTAGQLVKAGQPLDLDGGIGDFDSSGAFHLIHLMTFNTQLQYNFADVTHSWVTGGYSRLFSNNVSNLVGTDSLSSAGKVPYDRDEVWFVNFFHDFTPQLRTGIEYDFIRTSYADGVDAHDNRYMASAWFFF
jgi:hypothetical protein